MKYKICVVEDDEVIAALFIDILNRYFTKRHIEFQIKHYITGTALLDDFKEKFVVPDMVFMDVYLPDLNGIDTCHKLRSEGFIGDILIVTGSEDYMLSGYDVDARGYILKPYEPDKIYATLDRVLHRASVKTYAMQIRTSIIRIPVSDIHYVESNNTKCTIHCESGTEYTIYKKLDDIENELADRRFLRCHQSYLVNMDYVRTADNSFHLGNGEVVPIRRTEIKGIKERYKLYINGGKLCI